VLALTVYLIAEGGDQSICEIMGNDRFLCPKKERGGSESFHTNQLRLVFFLGKLNDTTYYKSI
jgi:hypothetical protein